jgi:hypothetical protein
MEVEQVRELQSTDNVLLSGDPEPLDKFGLAFPSAFCPVLWNEADAHLYDFRENLTSWSHMYTNKLPGQHRCPQAKLERNKPSNASLAPVERG